MARNYKSIEYSSGKFESKTYHKKQVFTNSSEGISSIQYRSESLEFNDNAGPLSYTISGSHYNFLYNLLSGSDAFNSYGKLFTNKSPSSAYSSGSVIYIPQQYYGEEIKPNTFQLRDSSTSRVINIIDDGNGNLYSTNAQFSQSNQMSQSQINQTYGTPVADPDGDGVGTYTGIPFGVGGTISSSENYVGNIHYQTGVVVISETGSFSGSVGGNGDSDINYTDVGRGDFTLKFETTQTIHSNEIVCNIKNHEFTATSNNTIWSGSISQNGLTPGISGSLSSWTPYATSIAFYDGVPNILSKITGDKTFFIKVFTDPGGTWSGTEHENQLTYMWDTRDTRINVPVGMTPNIPPGITVIYNANNILERTDLQGDGTWGTAIRNNIRPDSNMPTIPNPNEFTLLQTLKRGQKYVFINESDELIEWNIEYGQQSTGVPMIVAHFPRPIKIDNETDLTIIMRYDS